VPIVFLGYYRTSSPVLLLSCTGRLFGLYEYVPTFSMTLLMNQKRRIRHVNDIGIFAGKLMFDYDHCVIMTSDLLPMTG
jgi:hypothetical protein